MPRNIKIAAITVSTLDGMLRENYARALRLGQIALSGKPDLILFPEAFAAGYCGVDLAPYAEELDGPWPRKFRTLSRRGRCLVLFGMLERAPEGIRNVVVLFDRGELIGVHAKHSLWPDREMPYRDEPSLMVPGPGLDIFPTRFGRVAPLICYESVIEENWHQVAERGAELVLSPYNCTGDPAHNNLKYSPMFKLPSAWTDKTGTTYLGEKWIPNLGTAGAVDAQGKVLAKSAPGVEEIVHVELESRP